MNNFFSNLVGLIFHGRKFTIHQIENEDNDLLSFSLFMAFIIGAFHVIGIALVADVKFLSTPFTFAISIFIAGIVYTGIVFAKSALYYFLTGLYNKEERPMSGRNILKISFLSSYPFLLLPGAGIIAGFFKSAGLFIFIYFVLYIWACVVKYKSFKSVIKIHAYLFRLSYFIPAIVQFTVVSVLVAVAFITNFILIRSLVDTVAKSLASVLSMFGG